MSELGPLPPPRRPVLPSVIRFPSLRPTSDLVLFLPTQLPGLSAGGRKERREAEDPLPKEPVRKGARERATQRRMEPVDAAGRGRGMEGGDGRTEGIRPAFCQPDEDNPATHVWRSNINKSEEVHVHVSARD